MTQYKPSVAKQAAVMCSMFVLVLPALTAAGLAYIHFLEHGLGVDLDAKPENLIDGAVMVVSIFPMIVAMLAAIFVAGTLWMFVMSKVLPWSDIQYYTEMKSPRYPWISDTLDRIWKAMLKRRKDREPNNTSELIR